MKEVICHIDVYLYFMAKKHFDGQSNNISRYLYTTFTASKWSKVVSHSCSVITRTTRWVRKKGQFMKFKKSTADLSTGVLATQFEYHGSKIKILPFRSTFLTAIYKNDPKKRTIISEGHIPEIYSDNVHISRNWYYLTNLAFWLFLQK